MTRVLEFVDKAAWTPLVQWSRRPLIVAVPWSRRVRHYGTFLLLIALTSPLSHGYLGVALSLVELVAHTAIVLVTVALAILLVESLAWIAARWTPNRKNSISTGGFLLRATLAYLLSGPAVGLAHLPSSFTRTIMEKHAVATQGNTAWDLLPVVFLIIYLAYQVMRKEYLSKQLSALRRINDELKSASSGGYPPIESDRDAPAVIHVQSKGLVIPLNTESVVRIQADQNYCHVVADAGTDAMSKRYLVRMTLSEAQTRLPDHLFLQTHRSHLVNLRYVAALGQHGRRHELRLSNGDRVPVSRSRAKPVQTRITQFLAAMGGANPQ